jgi:hypothetical protein
VFGACIRFECSIWTEQVLAELRVGFSSVFDIFLDACKLSIFVLPRRGCFWVLLGVMLGVMTVLEYIFLLSYITSISGRDG